MQNFLKCFAYVIVQLLVIWAASGQRQFESFYAQSSKNYGPVAPKEPPSFDSTDVYQTLHFGANWTKHKLFWKSQDFDFEGRYMREQTCYSNTRSPCQLPFLRVFVVPFSHNDPGWLKTYEGYFDTQTRFILDSAVEKLTQLPEMTFVWSEISFLSKWWNSVANTTQKTLLRRLINQGRFEILTGGWVMPDEASPSIFALTHQLTEGHHWLKRNLNYKPVAAWSIDPFGHGSVMPYLLKSAGLQGMMIQRLHYAWKHWLAEHKYGDFFWQQRFDKTGEHKIHCLNAPYDLYPTKHSCGPVPEECMKFNFRNIPGKEHEEHLKYMKPVDRLNILQLADELMGQYRRTASLGNSGIVVTGLGNDFEFSEPLEWEQQYVNYMNLFKFINENPQRYNAHVQFGTLSQYFKSMKEAQVQLPKFNGDFFPYSDVYFPYPPAYWTGYYGTRPFWKKLSRETEDELRKAELLFTFTLNYLRQNNHSQEAEWLAENYNYLVMARRWVALFQHHDGITGTSPRPTMVDYAKKLFDAIRLSEHIQSVCVKLLIQRQVTGQYQPTLGNVGNTFGNLADQVPLKLKDVRGEHGVKKIVLFNSLGWDKSHLVRVLVDTPHVMVYGSGGEEVMSQINPKIGMDESGEAGIVAGQFEVVFMAYLGPFSLISYEIRKAPGRKSSNSTNPSNKAVSGTLICNNCGYDVEPISEPQVSLDNEFIQAEYDSKDGLLRRISRKDNKVSATINMEYGKYVVSRGSGAYLSRPSTDQFNNILADCGDQASPQVFLIYGPVLKEIFTICKEIVISSYVLQQGYPEALSAVYLTNSVKPLDVNYGAFFMRFQTDMETTTRSRYNGLQEPAFFTSNGLTAEKRVYVSRLPYEANFYPSVNYGFIQDTNSSRRFTVLTDRAHGFTSTMSGQLETIFDRRMPYDDGRGMNEGVNDPEDMVSNYVFMLEPLPRGHTEDKSLWKPSLAVQRASKFLNYQPSLFVDDNAKMSESSKNRSSRQQDMVSPRISLFSKVFPSDVFLLNFRTTANGSRDAPSKKALMTLQNLGHAESEYKNGTRLNTLGSDLKLEHFAVASDLVGNIDKDEVQNQSGLAGDVEKDVEQYPLEEGRMKVESLPKGKPFELKSFMVYFH